MDSQNFFKIILQKDLDDKKLALPGTAVMKYEECLRLGGEVFLEAPDGIVWPIGLTQHKGKVWLLKGWSQFAEFYSLAHGYVVIFSYEGNGSHFEVRIFMWNTLEFDYFESSSSEEDNPIGEADQVQVIKKNKGNRKHGVEEGTSQQRSSNRPSKEALMERTISKAKSFKSKNPYIVLQIQPSYLTHHIRVPAPFVKKYICQSGSCSVTLQTSNGRTWDVACFLNTYCGKEYGRLHSGGWTTFVRDNQVQAGDVCVFELISHLKFKTFIFRVDEEEE